MNSFMPINREGNGTPLEYSCLENPMDGGAWWATVHGVAKSRTRLSDFTFTFHFHALEKEMAIHSSVLAWRIPGMGEPGELPSIGSHKSRTRLRWLSMPIKEVEFTTLNFLQRQLQVQMVEIMQNPLRHKAGSGGGRNRGGEGEINFQKTSFRKTKCLQF